MKKRCFSRLCSPGVIKLVNRSDFWVYRSEIGVFCQSMSYEKAKLTL